MGEVTRSSGFSVSLSKATLDLDPGLTHSLQEESLADSFSAFSEFGLKLLRQLRDYFPATNSTAVYRLELLLKWVSQSRARGLKG